MPPGEPLILFIYLFLVVLSLCCCMGLFSSCGKWGLLSSCGVWTSQCGGISCSMGLGHVGFNSCSKWAQ